MKSGFSELFVAPSRRFAGTVVEMMWRPERLAETLAADENGAFKHAVRFFAQALVIAVAAAWGLNRFTHALLAGDGQELLAVVAVALSGVVVFVFTKMLGAPALTLRDVYQCYGFSHGGLLVVVTLISLVLLGGLGLARLSGLVPPLPDCDPQNAACCLAGRVPFLSSYFDRVALADAVTRTVVGLAFMLGMVAFVYFAWVFAVLLGRQRRVARWKSILAVIMTFVLYSTIGGGLLILVLAQLYPADFAACYPDVFTPRPAG